MVRYYDVAITNSSNNCNAHFIADSFSIHEDRFLFIYSKEFGNVTIKLLDCENISVSEFYENDIFCDFYI